MVLRVRTGRNSGTHFSDVSGIIGSPMMSRTPREDPASTARTSLSRSACVPWARSKVVVTHDDVSGKAAAARLALGDERTAGDFFGRTDLLSGLVRRCFRRPPLAGLNGRSVVCSRRRPATTLRGRDWWFVQPTHGRKPSGRSGGLGQAPVVLYPWLSPARVLDHGARGWSLLCPIAIANVLRRLLREPSAGSGPKVQRLIDLRVLSLRGHCSNVRLRPG
mmetsp:Transcript_10067/g.32483  ORF Transcript_10067/g.32483 Transcript_10067/m.32483 type:complete len:220 (-) Transcript_10067:526-1185(-)